MFVHLRKTLKLELDFRVAHLFKFFFIKKTSKMISAVDTLVGRSQNLPSLYLIIDCEVNKVVYMCSSLLQLAPGLCEWSKLKKTLKIMLDERSCNFELK